MEIAQTDHSDSTLPTNFHSKVAPLAPLTAPRLAILAKPLSNENFLDLKAKGVSVPEYNRGALKVGIVSMGGTSRLMGGLVYDMIESYLNKHKDDEGKQKWGVVAVGFSPHNRDGVLSTIDVLEKQNGLYTLVKKGVDPKGAVTTDYRVIGCVKEMLQAQDDQVAIIGHISSPAIKLVTMSILGKNYCLNKEGSGIDLNLPEAKDIKHDLENPRSPNSSIGILVEGLRQRMLLHSDADITVLCCDNLPAPSGNRVKAAILSYVENIEDPAGDRPLYKWIRDQAHFPNTMVDRIVPKPDKEAQDSVKKLTNISDGRTLVTELDEARCLVIQNTDQAAGQFFADNPFTDVQGVIFAGEDAPLYGVVKEAMVNADHVWSTLIGEFFLDNPKIHEVVTHPELKDLRRKFVDAELTPSILKHVPAGLEIEDYKELTEKRFANAGLPDPVSRISLEIYGRLPRILKIIDRLHANSIRNEDDLLSIERTCDAVACWVISRTHAKVAYGREFKLTVLDDDGKERGLETKATFEKINRAKELSGFQTVLESLGLKEASKGVFRQMCEMKMFGDTSDSSAFQKAACIAIERMASHVEAKKTE